MFTTKNNYNQITILIDVAIRSGKGKNVVNSRERLAQKVGAALGALHRTYFFHFDPENLKNRKRHF